MGVFNKDKVAKALYRPYSLTNFFYDYLPIDVISQQIEIFPNGNDDNKVICFNGNNSKEWSCISTKYLIDLNALYGGSRCLSYYKYNIDGSRIENITDWGLEQFREHYKNTKISKMDIFNYCYGVLQNPSYRQKYDLNLKREFPRIPYYKDFNKWAKWGKELMEFHINYETVKPFKLKEITDKEITKPKVKLKADKETGIITIDEATELSGVPKEAWLYKLGNRSAIEWVLDQYKEHKPTDPTILEKFNTYKFADYKKQVIDLLMRVTTVSVETMKIINEMEKLDK